MTEEQTLRFYAENAAEYATHRTRPTGERLSRFLAALKPGAKILELGCGNGEDAAFMLAKGFNVDATDGSPELAAEAQKRLGQAVTVLRFEDIDAANRYDGIWASACLLHVPAPRLKDIVAKIRLALRTPGLFVASFKAGAGEGNDRFGRYYNYPSAEKLEANYRAAGWDNLKIEQISGSGYDGLSTQWLWVTAER